MVHGGCSSVGCFAMTNAVVDEIWKLVTDALSNGQKRFQVEVFPFRMTPDRMEGYAGHPALPFWTELQAGHDLFEKTGIPPEVSVCKGSYAFEPGRPGSDGSRPVDERCPLREISTKPVSRS